MTASGPASSSKRAADHVELALERVLVVREAGAGGDDELPDERARRRRGATDVLGSTGTSRQHTTRWPSSSTVSPRAAARARARRSSSCGQEAHRDAVAARRRQRLGDDARGRMHPASAGGSRRRRPCRGRRPRRRGARGSRAPGARAGRSRAAASRPAARRTRRRRHRARRRGRRGPSSASRAEGLSCRGRCYLS